jgi:hypothetical protein
MSDNNKNLAGYSTSDIQKYLNGQLSAREMHELEKAALEDPFLADALEGMEIQQSLPEPTDFHQDLEELKERLDRRINQKDSTKFIPVARSWGKIAAAAIGLLGLTLMTYFFLSKGSGRQKTLAGGKNRQSLSPAPLAPQQRTDTGRQQPASGRDLSSSAAMKSAVTQTDKTKTGAAKMAPTKAAAPYLAATRIGSPFRQRPQAQASVEQDLESPERASFKAKANTVPLQHDSLPGRVDSSVFNLAVGNKIWQDPLVFSGKVTDEKNHPLPGASLSLKDNAGFSTVTDNNGQFNLKLPNNDSSLRLMVAYNGYEKFSMPLNDLNANLQENIIQLRPQPNSLNEVVVTGFGTERKEFLSGNLTEKELDGIRDHMDSLDQRAIPLIGWQAYKDYINSARKTMAVDSVIKGTEVISFIVNKSGILSSFKVEQSLSPAHDAAFIRLVQQGPAWRSLNGRKARARISLSF